VGGGTPYDPPIVPPVGTQPPPPGPAPRPDPVPEPEPQPPGALAITAATPHCDGLGLAAVLLRWTPADGAEGYEVMRDGALVPRHFLAGETFFEDVGLVADRSYLYVVRAANAVGVTSSDPFAVHVPADPCGVAPPPPPEPVPFPVERLRNGTFEEGDAAWARTGDAWVALDDLAAHTAPGFALLGTDELGVAKDGADGSIAQVVDVPAGATTMTLAFWAYPSTAEVAVEPRDVMHVTIEDVAGTFLESVVVLSNLDAGPPAYGLREFVLDAARYAGRVIHVRFHASSDAADPTVFRVDDVSLMTDG
jgi:hypothetical protein